MKHIFFVNSHIVYLMTKKTIDYHGIPKEDILILSVRQYVFPDDPDLSGITVIPYKFFSDLHFDSRRWILSSLIHRKKYILKTIQSADNAVKNIIGTSDFALYTPHHQGFNIEILLSMPQCMEINYLEEGSLAYAITQQNDAVKQCFSRSFFLALKRWLTNGRYGFPFRAEHYDINIPKFRHIYCCCEESFRQYPNKIVLGFPFQKMETIPDKLSAVIVFDGGIVPFDQQIESNEIAVKHFAKNHPHSIMHYKFHPSQTVKTRDRYHAHFSKLEKDYNISIQELPDEIILEQLIASLQDRLELYIICSSVGLYGVMGGSRVFTTAKHFTSNNIKLQNHYNTYGYIFSRYQEI